MVYPCLTNIVALFYTTLCWRCSLYIKSLTDKIAEYSSEEFETFHQLSILQKKKKAYDVLHKLQDVFSVPIFFMILANVLMCSAITGSLLLKSLDDFPIFLQIDLIYNLISGFSCVAATLWIAGRVPIEMNTFKNSFFQKVHERLLHHHAVVGLEELHLKTDLCNEPDFVLTGCNILPLKRSTILAVVGTLFTYTVLVINTNVSKDPCTIANSTRSSISLNSL
ncbi:uncharacterized protein NPIL_641801 [Nephila pilipes]|uniref:Gustatory receptor n=1 Tax=Nephila pilipes TaxID=299642 RepID=A0A8X6NND6_NEPPI|nr:uncharacterized protein NPIL_652851 [Nephila pilipes]GFU35134.1 uncharacterized protein NPIL_641801 [Nephila pilipes]